MGIDRNNAYEGKHVMPNGAQLTVQYFDRAATRKQFNQKLLRNDTNYKQIGWYWTNFRGLLPSSAAVWHGPYSSSSAALSAASLLFLKPRTKHPETTGTVTEPSQAARRTSGKRLAGG